MCSGSQPEAHSPSRLNRYQRNRRWQQATTRSTNATAQGGISSARRECRQPTMPSQAAGPGTAVTRNQRCKFRMLPNANQGAGGRVEEEGNPRKDVYLHLSPPKETARNVFLLGFSRLESVPTAATQNTAKQHLNPLPQVGGEKRSCLVPSQSSRGPPLKPFREVSMPATLALQADKIAD